MLVALSGMVIEVKPVQSEKAHNPILVTPSGMVTNVNPLQPEKAISPMLVTLSGMVTEVKLLQQVKAQLPMFVPHVIITSLSEPGTSLLLSPNSNPKFS